MRQGRVRIIGGKWRGRIIRFPVDGTLRPTPDRVRETLFNWLHTRVVGTRGLDLFAGTGALGIEALSRGAAWVTLVETDGARAGTMGSTLTRLGVENAEILHASAESAVTLLERSCARPFDLVFLDPPFRGALLDQIVARLAHSPLLSDDALIYIETETDDYETRLPPDWLPQKKQKAGQVSYYLVKRAAA